MIWLLILRHFPVSMYIWYVIHVCDRTDSWRTLNTCMTMCLIFENEPSWNVENDTRTDDVAEDADIHVDTPKTVIYSTLNEQEDKKTSEEWLTEFINWYCEYVYLIHVTVLWYFWDTLKLFCNIHKLCIIIAISFKHYCISNLHSTNPLSNYFFLYGTI